MTVFFPTATTQSGALISNTSKWDSASWLLALAGTMHFSSYLELHSATSLSQCKPSFQPVLLEGSSAKEIIIASPMLFQKVPHAHSSTSVRLRHSYRSTHRGGSSAKRLRVYSISESSILPAFLYRLCKKFMRAIDWIVRSDVGWFKANSSRRTPVSAVRFEAVSALASCPVVKRRVETLGIP